MVERVFDVFLELFVELDFLELRVHLLQLVDLIDEIVDLLFDLLEAAVLWLHLFVELENVSDQFQDLALDLGDEVLEVGDVCFVEEEAAAFFL